MKPVVQRAEYTYKPNYIIPVIVPANQMAIVYSLNNNLKNL